MKLRTFKSKKDKLFYFQFRSKKLGKIFLKNPIGFVSKIDRNDFLISIIHSLSNKKLYSVKKSKNGNSFLVIKNKFGKTLIRSKRLKKEDFNSVLNELKKNLPKLEKVASEKPNSNFTKLGIENNHNSANFTKKEILKKDKKPKAEKIYLKKGEYHFNDIYYDIFLSGNGKHYFSFINKEGKTVLLNGNIKGFDSVDDAEEVIEQVLKFAPERKNFEVKTAKDGKFFFNLYNDKNEKIAKSFFFRKKEILEDSINEFVGNVSGKISTQNIKTYTPTAKTSITPIVASIASTKSTNKMEKNDKEEIRRKAEAEERRKAAERERLALENKRKEEVASKERKAAAIAMAAKNENAHKVKNKAAAVTTQSKPRDKYSDKDPFDGCFKWIGILFLLAILILFFGYFFKGCDFGGNLLSDKANIENTNDNTLGSSALDTLTADNSQSNLNDTLSSDDKGDSDIGNKIEGDADGTNVNAASANNGEGKSSANNNNHLKGDCNCSDKAIVFEIPETEAKSVNKLGTNPQFGNTHGLSSADFLEELKFASSTNDWDRKYLNYLYKAMGYSNGFADAKASQISQAKITSGVKGILGFGKYSGYGYSKLDLKGQDLEVFRIEAANGCHINFMKTCGNLLFICE